MENHKEATSENSASAKASSGAVYLILIQITSRALTFVANQVLLRHVSPHDFGLAIQLEALSVSVMYTARESLRVAIQRQPLDPQTGLEKRRVLAQRVVNLAYLVLTAGFVLGFFFGTWYLYNASKEVTSSIDFWSTFQLYAIATFTELLCEPGFVIVQQYGHFGVRARAETIAAVSRCVFSCLTAFYMQMCPMKLSALPFGVGQFAYGVSLLLTYYFSVAGLAGKEGFSLFPRAIHGRIVNATDYYFSYLSKPLLSLVTAFYGQSLFKWILTQGDTLVMSFFANLQSQGIFAMASNYGGLVSRLLLQPIEESSRNVFGRYSSENVQRHNTLTNAGKACLQASHSRSGSFSSKDNRTATSSMSTPPSVPIMTTNQSSVSKANHASPFVNDDDTGALDGLNHLATVVRAYLLLIALPCITIVPRLFPFVVRILLGSKSQWSTEETFKLLSVYSYYIPCMAVNGVLDAFVTSSASEAELGIQSVIMAVVTAIYLVVAWLGLTILDLGAVGLVYANMLGMILRIAFSLWFIQAWAIRNYAEGSRLVRNLLKKSIPDIRCLAGALVVLAILQDGATSENFPMGLSIGSGSFNRALRDMLPNTLRDFSQALNTRISSRVVGVNQDDHVAEAATMAGALIVLASTILFAERDFLLQLVEPLLSRHLKDRIPMLFKKKSRGGRRENILRGS